MSANILLAAALLLSPQLQVPTPFPHGQLRSSFLTGAETLIDTVDALDLHADDAAFTPQFDHAKSTYAQLQSMSQDDREKDVAHNLNDMLFAVSACHLQAVGGNSTTQCEAQVARARTRSMEALGQHKSNGRWIDGPPPA